MTRTVGDIFGTYHLLEEIGFGGAGAVYRARHIHPAYAEQTFAIKRLHPMLIVDPDVISRFRREAYVLSMLEHPNIVKTFETGAEGDELFIAMEYVDGKDLGAVLDTKRGQPLPVHLAVFIACEVLAGLGYGHVLRDSGDTPLNVIHRDIKPSNVLVSFDGQVKLTDFGVATLTGQKTLDPEGSVMGTRGYIAPEALIGETADARSDLFALGALLFELLCGINPFGDESTSRVVRKNARARVPRPTKLNPTLPKGLEKVILTAMERDPARRFGSASEMIVALMPWAPRRAGMRLALAAYMRDTFVEQFGDLSRMRDSAPWRGSSSGRVALWAREVHRGAIAELLQQLDVEIAPAASMDALAAVLAGDRAPSAVLVDVAGGDFSPTVLLEALRHSPRIVPVIGVAETIDIEPARTAYAVGAVDLITPPFRPRRLLAALRSAFSDPVVLEEQPASDTAHRIGLRVRVVSPDFDLVARLTTSLHEWAYTADASTSAAEAIELTASASPNGVIYDLGADADPDPYFAERFRAAPGMGLVPIVYLTGEGQAPPPLPERCAVRARTDSDVVIASTFNQAQTNTHLGRTFTRYLTLLDAELRHGGRVFPANSIDLSRGGVLLQSDHVPSVGSVVRVALHLRGRIIEMPGAVARVQMPEDTADDQRARIGVCFRPAGPDAEEPLIAYITALAHCR